MQIQKNNIFELFPLWIWTKGNDPRALGDGPVATFHNANGSEAKEFISLCPHDATIIGVAQTVKVARLQSEFCTKDFFLSYEFSYEKCPEISPEIFEPFFCGSEKIPHNSCQNSHQIPKISLRKY